MKPRLNSTFGVPASNAHASVVPSSVFTSMWIQTWGIDPLDSRDRAAELDRPVGVEFGRKCVMRRHRLGCYRQPQADPDDRTQTRNQ